MLTPGLCGAPPLAAVRAPAAPRLAFGLLVALVVVLQFGPLIGLIGFRLSDDPLWALSGASRDLLVAALLLAALGGLAGRGPEVAWPRSARWALAVVAAYGLASLVSSPGLFALAYNLRRLALVPLLFVALLSIRWSPRQIEQAFALIAASSALVALLGLAERLAPDTLWTEWLEIERFTAANGFDRFGSLAFAQSGRYFSWDLEAWTGAPVRRMIASYLEPTTLAAGMSVALVIACARQARGHSALLLGGLATLCGLLTLSKGFAVFLGLLAAWRLLGVPAPRQVLAIAGATVLAALVATAQGWTDGPFAHLAGVASALGHLADGHWLGDGIGEAGNYTSADNDVGTESGLGNALAQAGVAAFVPLFWLRAVARDVMDRADLSRDPGGPWIAAWALFWTSSYVFSASSQGVGGNALGFAVLALYLHPSFHRSTP